MLLFINCDDQRAIELMDELIRRGHYVTNELKDLKYADIIYLGMRGFDRKNRIVMHNETRTFQENLFEQIKQGCLVLTLVYNEYLQELSKRYNFVYKAFLNDENFLYINGILTAEGVIAYMIQHRPFPIYQSRILILGYGHCAKPIIKRLIGMEAEVYVGVRNKKYKMDIEKNGAHFLLINDIDLSNIDIVINTIPSIVIDNNVLDKANPKVTIIDIASFPYGLDHHYALSHGFDAQILSSIPSKYAYRYIGQLMACKMEGMIKYA